MSMWDYLTVSNETLYYSPLVLLVYILSLEFSSGMGNVWLRVNESGTKSFSLGGIIKYFYEPLRDKTLWIYPQVWSLNPYIYSYCVLKTIDVISNNYLNSINSLDNNETS